MDINLTVVIQACNFFIAYALLRTFFFGPIIEIIQQEESEKKSLQMKVAYHKQELELQKEACQNQWLECRRYFRIHHPVELTQHQAIFKNISPYVTVHNISDADIAQHSDEVKKALEEKIKHVWS